jgi:phytoene dehydrogenase-like protein
VVIRWNEQNGRVPNPLERRADDDHDAIVIGAGHNGLITAAYLARAGLSVLLVEARDTVGGTAASERFGGAIVNICNCDHVTFRAMPIIDELDLGRHGLEYQDVDPAQHHIAWGDGTSWTHHHDLDATLDSIGRVLPGEVAGYRRYAKAAIPAIRMTLEAAKERPTRTALTKIGLRKKLTGAPVLLRWSQRSAADVLRTFFTHDALTGTATVGGPMVWGITPEMPGSGLGALSHAMKHVLRVGRPVGGSGAMPDAVLASFLVAGGTLRTSTRVTAIDCEGDAVRGVTLSDGTQPRARIVVSACDPHRTFLQWLRHAPAGATSTIDRWRAIAQHDGYESKIDAIVSAPPVLRAIGAPTASTVVVAPSLAEIDRGYHEMLQGRVLDRPGFLVNVPTVLDRTMAPAEHPDRHVLSLEVLYTPYRLTGGWPGSTEPARWLELLAGLCEPGLLDSIVEYRAMTPDVYERDFHLPAGHATSFAGGPLAVFRAKDPELTSYETAVPGLFLTGAATFPGAGVWGASGRNCAAVVLEAIGAG